MPFELALVIAIVIFVATIVVMAIVIGGRRQRAQEEDLRREATARGWQFETGRERGHRVQRWKGTTDGVPWVAESTVHGSDSKRRQYIGRWHGSFSPGIHGAIVAVGLPKGKETPAFSVAQGDGIFARMAQKIAGFAFDKAIDTYFGDGPGKQVDAGALHRVDREQIPGFVVMAADKDEGERILSQGLEHALVTAANTQGSVLAEDKRPWILLLPNGVSLARLQRFRDINEIDGFVRAGVGLTRAFTFGRRSPS